jgi:lysophospholipase L1-like esterase
VGFFYSNRLGGFLPGHAMAASQPANFNLQEFTDAGLLMVGGRLYTYAYGTTTQKVAYTDPAGTVPHTYTSDGAGGQYIALNARGELPAPLYLAADGSYDIALKRVDGSTVWTRKADGVDNSIIAFTAPGGAARIGFQPSGTITAENVQAAIEEVRDDVGAVATSVAALANPTGAGAIGYIGVEPDAVATTVQARVRELGASAPTAVLPNIGTVGNRNCTILGDSISHGAFALNTYLHGWARIFARCFNAEVGATSYGFVNFLSLGSGATSTSDIHVINFFGAAWNGIDSSTDAGAADYPCGLAMRPTDSTSAINISIPSFQNRAQIYYGKRPGSAPFTITVNGGAPVTVVTDAAAGWAVQEVSIVDGGYGDATIIIQSTNGVTQPDIIGISYLSSAVEPVVNNYSNSGRRLRYLGENLIAGLMQESSMMIVALGHNDQGDADADDSYYAAFMQRITWLTTYAKQYGVRLVVPDFCWSAAKSSRTRLALRKLAADANGIHIDLPGEIFRNREQIAPGDARSSYLVDTLKMWTDGSHPNKAGHQWVAETIAKRIGLACSSKARALAFHDWWLPLTLKPATGVYNYFTSPSQVSSFKRNGSQVLIRAFLHQSSSASFPVGTFQLQDAWNAKAELGVFQGYAAPVVVRDDTGAIVSSVFAGASGSIKLRVADGTWLNYQDFTFSMPSA